MTHKGLSVLQKDKLARINAAISAGEVVNHEGTKLAEVLVEALITDDGKRLYPVDDGIPVMLEDESISVEQLV